MGKGEHISQGPPPTGKPCHFLRYSAILFYARKLSVLQKDISGVLFVHVRHYAKKKQQNITKPQCRPLLARETRYDTMDRATSVRP